MCNSCVLPTSLAIYYVFKESYKCMQYVSGSSIICNMHTQTLRTYMYRFSTDLLLWEPASPSFVEKANAKSMLFSCMDVLQPAATQEDRFQMCKSVLKEGKGITYVHRSYWLKLKIIANPWHFVQKSWQDLLVISVVFAS